MSVGRVKKNTQSGFNLNRFLFVEDFRVGHGMSLLVLVSFLLLSTNTAAQITSDAVTFTEIPLDKQLVARDGNNKGKVLFEGEVDDSPQYDEIKIVVRKSELPGYSKEYIETLNYSGGVALFTIEAEIEAEFSNFYFEIELKNGGSTKIQLR